MSNTNYVYLAGPILNLSYKEATDWRIQVKKELPYWIRTLSPMRGKEFLQANENIQQSYENSIMSSAKAINIRDYNDVKRSSALLVNFLGALKVSIGTVMEVAWTKALGIPVICVMEKDNVHRHIMLEDACSFIVGDLKTAMDIIVRLLGDDQQVKEYNTPFNTWDHPAEIRGEETEEEKSDAQKEFEELMRKIREEIKKSDKPKIDDLNPKNPNWFPPSTPGNLQYPWTSPFNPWEGPYYYPYTISF